MADFMPQHATNPEPATALVPAVYYDMFYLRLMGLNFEEIAAKTLNPATGKPYSYDHVRRLFSAGHACHNLWHRWKEVAKQNSLEEVFDMVVGQLPDIIRTRIADAKGFGPTAIASTKIIIDLIMGRPERLVYQNNSQININVTPEEEESIIKAVANFGLLKNKNDDNNSPAQDNNPQPKVAETDGQKS